MAEVVLKNIGKTYTNGYQAIKGLSLDIKDKEFVVFVGPSGSGKSTALRMIAGLETISAGEMYIGDTLVNNIPPKDRDIAMVFQSYALYPHMTVRDNIAFSLKLKGVSKQERYKRAAEVAEPLELTQVLDRKPSALSGGQRQRVALGRAMVRNPKVFLLDEPLSNLDAKLRVSMRSTIAELHRQLETTFIYVTHDQTEAMTMGDRIVVLDHGDVMQFDTPGNLYANPENKFVAEFIGSPQMNILNGKLIQTEEGPALEFPREVFVLSDDIASRLRVEAKGQLVYVGIRPEDLYYAEKKDHKNVITAYTKNVEQVGADTFVYFDFLSADRECTARFNPARYVAVRQDIFIRFDMSKVHIFDKETEVSLLDPFDFYLEGTPDKLK